jgi:hypothetical protein
MSMPISNGSSVEVVTSAQRQIKRLEQVLGRKTLENEILREAVDFAKVKKWLARSPVLRLTRYSNRLALENSGSS